MENDWYLECEATETFLLNEKIAEVIARQGCCLECGSADGKMQWQSVADQRERGNFVKSAPPGGEG